jgi:hypothetical protein
VTNIHSPQPKKAGIGFEWVATLIIVGLVAAALAFVYQAWLSLKVRETTQSFEDLVQYDQMMSWVDLQMESTKLKLKHLDPGPAPAWYLPSYYVDWLPKQKAYEAMQESLVQLQNQKMKLVREGKLRVEKARGIWNYGIAPILHGLLAITLMITGLRLAFRVALIRGLFGWVRL